MASDEIFEDDELLDDDDDVESEETDSDEEGEDDVAVDVIVAPGVTDDDSDLDDDTNDSDVELALDEMMAERVKVVSDDDDDEEPTTPAEDSTDLGESVLPQQDDEFRCTSCRLLKKKSQLARPGTQICRDCV
jgi:hypothetical protein